MTSTAPDLATSNEGHAPIRVLLVDDDALVRAGLKMVLDMNEDLEVVGEAGDGIEGVALAEALQPDVILMDIRMPEMDGIEATRRITGGTRGAGASDDPSTVDAAAPGPRVLVLTTFEIDEYVYDAVRAGASGFLLKRSPPEEVIAGVRVVAAGDSLLSPSVTRRLLEEFARSTASSADRPAEVTVDALTPREQEVLVLIAHGLSNREIADELIVGEATVKTHVKRILMKLHLRDRVHAVVYAYEMGLVRPRT
jgi:DNA-binding NarL/FixJ family response regulator